MASSDKPQRPHRPWLIALVAVNLVGIALIFVFRATCDPAFGSDMCPEVVLSALVVMLVFVVDITAFVLLFARFAIRLDRRHRSFRPHDPET